MRRAHVVWLLVGLVAAFLVQYRFLVAFPQPILFGDPVGYYNTGLRFLEAWHQLRADGSWGQAFESVRGLSYLAGVGSLFAGLEALRPGGYAFFRLVFALFNTLGMLGAFLLGRRLASRNAGGFLALALAILHPTFSVQTGRLYPDPLTGCLLVWAAWLYVEGVKRERARLVVLAGLVLDAALLIRAQLVLVMLLVIPAVLLATLPLWLRRPFARRAAGAVVLAFLPLAATWIGMEAAVGNRDDVIQLGNATFHPTYPMGFWQFLATEGWPGPYRFKTDPFYRELIKENERAPGFMRSQLKQYLFTAGYVARRPWLSMTQVLENAYRLYSRPANDYKWDYPIDATYQVWLHRSVCVLAVAGLALFASEDLALLGVFLMPLTLLVLHGMVFAWPRYNIPALLTLIAVAAATTVRLVQGRGALKVWTSRRFGVGAGIVLAAGIVALLMGSRWPEVAHGASVLAWLLLLAIPFVLVARVSRGRHSGRWSACAWAGLALILLGHVSRDRLWHESVVTLDRTGEEVVQEIALGPEAAARLRVASEAFVALDLQIPRGDRHGLELEINGRTYDGSALLPTMPYLPESTWAGGRDWRGYRQWWVVALDRSLLPRRGGCAVRVVLRARSAGAVRLAFDRFSDQREWYEGPSFGEWPNAVPLKLEYDADYRIERRYRLQSTSTQTSVGVGAHARPVRALARIRIVTLANNQGEATWRTGSAHASRAAFGFFAYSGERGSGELSVDGRPQLSFPLGPSGDLDIEGGSGLYSLCYRALAPRGDKPYGAFVLEGPVLQPGQPLDLRVHFLTGMDLKPMYFVVDSHRSVADLPQFFDACGVAPGVARVNGAAEILDATRNAYPRDTGRWGLDAVF